MRTRKLRSKTPRRRVYVTFSIPEDVNVLLHTVVEKRGLSEFATKALERALEEEQRTLQEAYENANEDPDRNRTIQEWAVLEKEGWDEE